MPGRWRGRRRVARRRAEHWESDLPGGGAGDGESAVALPAPPAGAASRLNGLCRVTWPRSPGAGCGSPLNPGGHSPVASGRPRPHHRRRRQAKIHRWAWRVQGPLGSALSIERKFDGRWKRRQDRGRMAGSWSSSEGDVYRGSGQHRHSMRTWAGAGGSWSGAGGGRGLQGCSCTCLLLMTSHVHLLVEGTCRRT